MRCGDLPGHGVLPGGEAQRPLPGVSAPSPPRATRNICELEVLPVRENPEDEPSRAPVRSSYGGWGVGVQGWGTQEVTRPSAHSEH